MLNVAQQHFFVFNAQITSGSKGPIERSKINPVHHLIFCFRCPGSLWRKESDPEEQDHFHPHGRQIQKLNSLIIFDFAGSQLPY
jgi:hypothetical protein